MSLVGILLAIGISLLILAIIVAVIFVALIITMIVLARKHPILSLFVFIVILAMSLVQLADPVTFIFGVVELVTVIVTGIILLKVEYKRLEKALR